jgi:hypothetical protein
VRAKVRATLDFNSKQQQRRNQILFREVNERVREVAAPLLGAHKEGEFLCECGHEACVETIRLDVEEYEAVRASPHRFVMVPGHQDGKVQATTVQGNGRFVVVESSAFREQAASHNTPVGATAERWPISS